MTRGRRESCGVHVMTVGHISSHLITPTDPQGEEACSKRISSQQASVIEISVRDLVHMT